jgi:intracellular sulfur oxidation DsrE/DsrF family protein
MNTEQKFSDEFLNAFVDDQLSLEERQQVYACLAKDDALNRQVCELRKMHSLVRLAYEQPPLPPQGLKSLTAGRKLGLGLAAGLALMIGGVAGWFLHQSPAPVPATVAQALPDAKDPTKVLFHVSDGHPEHLRNALDEVEGLMQHYRKAHEKARVEVVANGEGLSLLLAGISPYAERVRRMQKEYPGLTFVACQNTIDRIQHEVGLTVKLLPGVEVIDSGVAQIMRRQQEGWAYIQV